MPKASLTGTGRLVFLGRDFRESGVLARFFFTIGWCAAWGQSEDRVERWAQSFRSWHEAAPENSAKMCGHNSPLPALISPTSMTLTLSIPLSSHLPPPPSSLSTPMPDHTVSSVLIAKIELSVCVSVMVCGILPWQDRAGTAREECQ